MAEVVRGGFFRLTSLSFVAAFTQRTEVRFGRLAPPPSRHPEKFPRENLGYVHA